MNSEKLFVLWRFSASFSNRRDEICSKCSNAKPGLYHHRRESCVSGMMSSSHDLHLRNLCFLAIANLAILFLDHGALLPCQGRERCSSCAMVPGLQVLWSLPSLLPVPKPGWGTRGASESWLQPGAVTCLWESRWLHRNAQPAALQPLSGGESGVPRHQARTGELGPAHLAWYVPEEQGR